MEFLTKISSPVLLNGYIIDIVTRKPTEIKELLVIVIEKKNIQLLNAILQHVNVELIRSFNTNYLLLAIKNCFVEGVETFLKLKIWSPNCRDPSNRSALAIAILNSSSDCAIKLLEHGANPNTGGAGAPPMVLASKCNDTIVMQKLLEAGALVDNADDQGRTPLFYAAKSAIGVTMLLKAGASPDCTETSSGSTPLMAACIEGFDRCVELMVKKTHEPNIKDRFGHTALTYSSIQGHVSSVRALLSVGASVTICDQNGFSLLALTYQHRQFGSMITLLQETPSFPKSERTSVSPLYLSVRNGLLEYAVALLYAGVDRHFMKQALQDLQNSNIENKGYIIDKLVSLNIQEPSSLQILCRREIRRSLGCPIMKRAKDLDLPQCIIDFILLKSLNLLYSSPPEMLLPYIV